MTAPTTMNKLIHGGVRRDLARLLDGLAAIRDGDAARAAQLAMAWRYLYKELTYHHHSEHEIAWPALRQVGVSSNVLAEMDAEHGKLADALTEANTAMFALERAPTSVNAASARDAIVALQTVAEQHFVHEETE